MKSIMFFFHIWLALCIIGLLVSHVQGDVFAVGSINQSHVFDDLESEFGTRLGTDPLLGFLELAQPVDACKEIKQRSFQNASIGNVTLNAFVIIERGNCDFAIKVFNAQQAKFDAAIVHGVESDVLVRMSSVYKVLLGRLLFKPTFYVLQTCLFLIGLLRTNGKNRSLFSDLSEQIVIPSVFVGAFSGHALRSYYLHKNGTYPYIELLSNGDPFSLQYYLIPFCVVLGTCTVAMVGFLLVRFLRNRHRQRRNRLSRQRLKQLPVKLFVKGDEYDVCAICLDDYEEGEKLRILPCNHAYHCKCVDPWLTTSKRVCPLCKRKVLSDDESSNSDTDYDDDTDNSEEAPLLRNANAASPNAARFATGFSVENPFRRNYAQGSPASTSTSLASSQPASDIPTSSLLSRASEIPSSFTDNQDASPEFHAQHGTEPSHRIVIADVSPLHPDMASSMVSCQSSEAFSCQSESESPLRSYQVNPEDYAIIDVTTSHHSAHDNVAFNDDSTSNDEPPVA